MCIKSPSGRGLLFREGRAIVVLVEGWCWCLVSMLIVRSMFDEGRQGRGKASGGRRLLLDGAARHVGR